MSEDDAEIERERQLAEEQARTADEAAAAERERTDALRKLREAVEKQNAIAASAMGLDLETTIRAIGDILSRDLGRRVAARSSMPGSGRLAPPAIAVPKPQAAAMLGVSVDSFERHIQSELKVIRRGRLRLYAVAELERWARESSEGTVPNG